MRRARVWKTLALVMMLFALATGLCAAKDKDEMTFMWEEDGPGYGEKFKYYIDDKETKIIDIGGRKYLQMYWQRNKLFMEQFWMVMTWREAEKAHFTEIFDIENKKAFYLEFLNKDHNPKKGKFDISTMPQNSFPYGLYEQKVIQWMEANRKSILDEIRKANGNTAGAQSTGPVAKDGEWNFLQLLGDGPVQYRPRMSNAQLTPLAMDDSVHLYVGGLSKHEINIDNSIRPIKCDPSTNLYLLYGAYMYETTVGSRGPDVIRETRTGYPLMAIFEYDEENNAFILYGHDYDENNNIYYCPAQRLNIVDKNTVEKSFIPIGDYYDDTVLRFQYMKSDRYNDEYGYQGYCWEMEIIGGESAAAPIQSPVYEEKYNNEVGVDGLFAFLACKGKVGYAPDVVYTTRQF